MAPLLVFCGHESCGKLAVGTLSVIVWERGNPEAGERLMPLCEDHRFDGEAILYETQKQLPVNYKMETRWEEDVKVP